MIKNLNAYTSLFFLSNIYYLLDANDIIYLSSFIILLITSVIFHSTKLKYIGYIDKLATYNIVFQGGISLLENHSKNTLISIIVILCFLSVVYLYYYGYIFDKFCFDKKYNEICHGVLHLQSSIGHLFIILLMKMYN